MIKKLLAIICLLTACVAPMRATGSWTIYPLFNGECSQMIETPDILYYVSNSSLFSYDKNTEETRSYNVNNKLSDNLINNIYYNPKYNFLLVVYDNCNMDVLYDNGRLINLPEIYQTNLSVEKKINCVNTDGDYISVATNFGYVIYDAKQMIVKESRVWNMNIPVATVANGFVIVQYSGEGYYAPLDSKHVKFEDFKMFRAGLGASIIQTVGNTFFYYNAYERHYLKAHTLKFDGSSTPYLLTKMFNVGTSPKLMQPYKDGYYTISGNTIFMADREGNDAGTFTIPDELVSYDVCFWDSPSDLLVSNSNGLALYTVTNGTASQRTEFYRPEGMTCQRVGYITKSADGQRVYFTNMACQNFRTCGATDKNAFGNKQTTDYIENGEIHNLVLPADEFPAGLGRDGEDLIIEDPLNPKRCYMVSRHNGLYIIDDGHLTNIFNENNSLMQRNWIMQCYQIAFDQYNNLLLAQNDYANSTLNVIPYESLYGKSSLSSSDMYQFDYNQMNEFPFKIENRYGICRQSGIIAISTSVQSGGMLFIDTQGKKKWDMSKSVKVTSFVDQDGNTVAPLFITFLVEDQLGRLWIGTDDGVLEVTDPTKVFEANFRVNRIKVPRNDGTNYADYLLTGEQVNWISVDPANRKWIATQNSGLYLVSANGDQILEHFTIANSPLPTNTVNAVEASSIDNMVYLGTNYGPIAYSSDASPSADNYDNVLVYPNPVRPDYTGWINITGLMDNSLVKIADAAGNVVFQGKSEGGMLSWDGCNLGGQRVRSGVYFVMASSGDSASNFATVAKLMVIK